MELVEPAIDIDTIEVPKGYKLFDGELVEKPKVSNSSSWVAGEVYFRLKATLCPSEHSEFLQQAGCRV
jgi:hypothetical protein